MDIEELEDMTQKALGQYGFEMMTRVLAEACRRKSEDLAGQIGIKSTELELWETRANELEEIE